MNIKNLTKKQLLKRLNRLIKKNLKNNRWVKYIEYQLKQRRIK